MSKNILYPIILDNTKCKNPKCKKPITATEGYVCLFSPERANSETGNHEFFCDTRCHLEYVEEERFIAMTSNHSNIRYLEHER